MQMPRDAHLHRANRLTTGGRHEDDLLRGPNLLALFVGDDERRFAGRIGRHLAHLHQVRVLHQDLVAGADAAADGAHRAAAARHQLDDVAADQRRFGGGLMVLVVVAALLRRLLLDDRAGLQLVEVKKSI